MLAAIARLILWWIASGALTVGSYFQMSLGMRDDYLSDILVGGAAVMICCLWLLVLVFATLEAFGVGPPMLLHTVVQVVEQ